MSRLAGPLRLIGLGWYVAICIAGGVVAGAWADGVLHVAPLFTLLGLFLGLAASFVGVYRMVVLAVQDQDQDQDQDQG